MTMHDVFAGVKRILPRPVANFFRGAATAFIVPNLLAYRSGHWRSAFAARAVDQAGKPIPWLTYPCVDYLERQSFAGRSVLEFGGGQSTRWWASRATSVTTIETNAAWAQELGRDAPANAHIIHLDLAQKPRAAFVDEVAERLRSEHPEPFDVIVIDSFEYRSSYAEIARAMLTQDGVIICDNSDGYRIFEAFKDCGMQRVDFYGIAPGTSLPTATSIYFRDRSFLFDNSRPIARAPA